MTRHVVAGDGTIDILVNLTGPLGQAARRHAVKRSVRVDILAAMILERVLRDDLVKAILDDGK